MSKYTHEEFLKDFIEEHNIKFTKKGTFLGNDTCLISLGNEYSNNKQLDLETSIVIDDFCEWLENLLKVCDGFEEMKR